MTSSVKPFLKALRMFLLLFGLASLLAGMHNVDISYNMKLINSYSYAILDVSNCRIEYPELWNQDGFPNGSFMNSRELYMLGISLEIFGVILLLFAFMLIQ